MRSSRHSSPGGFVGVGSWAEKLHPFLVSHVEGLRKQSRTCCFCVKEVAGLPITILERLLLHMSKVHASLARELWREHGDQWATTLMCSVIPHGLQATVKMLRNTSEEAVQAVSSLLVSIIHLGQQCYALRGRRLEEDPTDSYLRKVYALLTGC